jgi:SAM-dependent methyltransferase
VSPAVDWVEYWSDTGYDAAFWRRSLQDYAERLHEQVPFAETDCVLDYGAGPGFLAPPLAGRVAELCLAERSAVLCDHARELTAGLEHVTVVRLAEHEGPEVLPHRAFDVVVVNSVLQYLTREEAREVLARLGERLAPDGRLVVSDLVPPGSSLLPELRDVVGAYRRWFGVWAFLKHLAWELGKLPARRKLPLTRYDRAGFEALVQDGFSVQWIDNPTICRSRQACVLRPR